MSIDTVLHEFPWIEYNDTLNRSRLVLLWPRNAIFTSQLLSQVCSLDVYDRHPHAERFNARALQGVDWEKTIIVIDSQSRLVLAPEPVRDLVQLDRRLRYTEAADRIFGPFRVLPLLQVFSLQWIWIILTIAVLLSLELFRKRPLRLALPNKTLGEPKHSRR